MRFIPGACLPHRPNHHPTSRPLTAILGCLCLHHSTQTRWVNGIVEDIYPDLLGPSLVLRFYRGLFYGKFCITVGGSHGCVGRLHPNGQGKESRKLVSERIFAPSGFSHHSLTLIYSRDIICMGPVVVPDRAGIGF